MPLEELGAGGWESGLEDVLDRFERPTHRGVLASARNGSARNPRCGDVVTIYVDVIDDRLARAVWDGHGCTISMVAADVLAELCEGRSVAEALALDVHEIVQEIGPLRTRLDCVSVGLSALHDSLARA